MLGLLTTLKKIFYKKISKQKHNCYEQRTKVNIMQMILSFIIVCNAEVLEKCYLSCRESKTYTMMNDS